VKPATTKRVATVKKAEAKAPDPWAAFIVAEGYRRTHLAVQAAVGHREARFIPSPAGLEVWAGESRDQLQLLLTIPSAASPTW
jgi:hypothetical protein